MSLPLRACASRSRALRAKNPSASSRRHVVARCSGNGALQQESMERLFEEYQSTSNAVLLEEQTKGGRLFSLDFMRWIDDAEQNCDDPERKERLGALAGRIMSLRRGVVPTAELSADSMSSDPAQPSGSKQLDETVPLEPWPTWPRQKRWDPEHEMQKQALVTALKSAVKEQRARAVMEITGRAPVQHLNNEDLQARLASVNAARRISEFLATVEDPVERRSLLIEALTPPEPPSSSSSGNATPQAEKSMSDLLASLVDTMEGSMEGSDTPATASDPSNDAEAAPQQISDTGDNEITQRPVEAAPAADGTQTEAESRSREQESESEVVEDLLHTSPLQLLQAVKEMLSELESKRDGKDGNESSRSAAAAAQQMPQSNAYEELPPEVAIARLQELKADALQAWNDTF